MQKKKLKKRKFKIASLLLMCVAAVMMLCTMLSTNVYAATTTTSQDSYVPEDPTIYDTNWSKANVKHWLYRNSLLGLFHKTYSYIRITDKNGKFINDITRLEATYIYEGEKVHINEKMDSDASNYLGLAKDERKIGILTTWENHCDTSWFGLDSYEECVDRFDDFKSCNYVWSWGGHVSEIIYLYVWYLDPITGEELAASFCPNGEHPKYDSTGKLTGIYNTEEELLENYTLNEKGIPSMIATDGTLDPVLTPEDQLVDSYTEDPGFIDMLTPGVSTPSNNFNFMNIIYIMAAIFVGLLLLAILLKFITLLFKKVGGK